MTTHLGLPPNLQAESDPCSLSYQGFYQQVSAVSGPASSPERPTVNPSPEKKKRRWWNVFKRRKSVKKTPGNHANKSGFLTPYEYKQLHRTPSRSSKRSRISSEARISSKRNARPSLDESSAPPISNNLEPAPSKEKRGSAPSINLIGPTVKGRNTHLRVHSYEGESTPPAQRDSVRFSHPAVQIVHRPRAPSSPTTMRTSTPVDVPDDACSVATFQTSDILAVNEDWATPIRPKTMWRFSDQFTTEDGQRTTFDDFKARLDSHKLRSSGDYSSVEKRKSADRPPSLHFIPRSSSISLDAPPQLPAVAVVDVQKNRTDALKLLENGGVLAVMPKEDVPNTAVTVPSYQYPVALVPSQYPQTLMPGSHNANQRPVSCPGPIAKAQTYLAYNPSSTAIFNKSDGAQREATTRVKQKGKAVAIAPSNLQQTLDRAETPESFAAETQHKSHYARVESGVFDGPMMPIDRPPNPSPPSSDTQSIRRKPLPIGQSFLESPTPPESPEVSAASLVPLSSDIATVQKSASAPDLRRSKALPAAPPVPQLPSAEKLMVSGHFPAPHPMNDNGYPVMSREEARRFSATPKYQRRSINDVEAKLLKELAKKPETAVRDKKAVKLEREKAELDKKMAKQQAKIAKKEKRKAENMKHDDLVRQQKQINDGIKKLLNI